MTGRGDLKSKAPLLYSQFETWETGYEEAHAKEFTRDQLVGYFKESPDDEKGRLPQLLFPLVPEVENPTMFILTFLVAKQPN